MVKEEKSISNMYVVDWIFVPSPHLYIDALTLNMTIVEDRHYEVMVKVKWVHRGATLIW